MEIEVTNATFYKIMNSTDFTDTESEDLYTKEFYYNSEIEQRGLILYNYSSGNTIKQFYLTDINA